MAFTEDLGEFLDTTHGFAEIATFGGNDVTGIFLNDYAEGDMTAGTKPIFAAKTADVQAYARGTAVVVRGVNYKLAEHQPDVSGMTRVILETA